MMKSIFTVRETSEFLRVPIDYVRRTIREVPSVGHSIHSDGHWQRVIKAQEIETVAAYCFLVLGAMSAIR